MPDRNMKTRGMGVHPHKHVWGPWVYPVLGLPSRTCKHCSYVKLWPKDKPVPPPDAR